MGGLRLPLAEGGDIGATNLGLRLMHLLMSHPGQVLESVSYTHLTLPTTPYV